jgi:flagellar hook assembly protein FlgD
VHNNSSETTIDFIVAESDELALNHVLNYPNPFTTNTEFMFEHNQSCERLFVKVQIFTVSGKLVKTINEYVEPQGFRVRNVHWDGMDEFGDPLARGTYIYKITASDDLGNKADKIEKLVILR